MTPTEYIQLKAFARLDGVKLFLLWLTSFVCYIIGLRSPGLGLVALILALVTPFLCFRLLRHFRDHVRDGVISFMRGWAYVVFLFFYAGLLFAVAQFVYFKWIDHGYFASALSEMLAMPENAETIRQLGLGSASEMTEILTQASPIETALNILTTNLLIGCAIALPIAAVSKRDSLQKVE